MLQFAHAHANGVHVKDETGIHFIPYQKPPVRRHRRPDPAAEPDGTNYRYFSPPLRNPVLPSHTHLAQLFLQAH